MGAYAKYLSYYTRGGQEMPAGADMTSDAILD
jgi:hypothetical protein